MTEGQSAQLFGLGYRRHEGPRREPVWAVVALAVFTIRRVLGLGRGARHKVLPAITLAVAYVPALLSVSIAALADDVRSEQLISYAEYTFFIGSALALFAALVAPEALCPDRRTGMLGHYLAGPLDRNRYLAGKAAAVLAVMLSITVGPLLFMLAAFVVAGHGPSASETPALLLRILAVGLLTALLYASLSLAVSSFTTRRAAAAVAIVLLLLVPPIVSASAIESAGAPEELDLVSIPFVAADLSSRIFGESSTDGPPITEVSTWLAGGALAAFVLAGAAACWIRYRRVEGFR
jgi:ABC-type transport system involved in multi-copper enzyme maturation permease subunit